MFKKLANFGIAALFAVSLSGCIVIGGDHDDDNYESWRAVQKENLQTISNLSLGTSRSQVLDIMGVPAFSEAVTKGDEQYQILYYRTQHRHSDGETTKDETTPLVFKNDSLIGWGQQAVSSIY